MMSVSRREWYSRNSSGASGGRIALLRETIRASPAPSSTFFWSLQRSDFAQSKRRDRPKKNRSRQTCASSVRSKLPRPPGPPGPARRQVTTTTSLRNESGFGSMDGRASISTTSESGLMFRAK